MNVDELPVRCLVHRTLAGTEVAARLVDTPAERYRASFAFIYMVSAESQEHYKQASFARGDGGILYCVINIIAHFCRRNESFKLRAVSNGNWSDSLCMGHTESPWAGYVLLFLLFLRWIVAEADCTTTLPGLYYDVLD